MARSREVPMRSDRVLATTDFHTAGIGMRLLTSGLGHLPGATIGTSAAGSRSTWTISGPASVWSLAAIAAC